MTFDIFSNLGKFFRKGMIYGVIFSLSFPHFAWATEAIIELDFKDSQTPQRLHVIPRLSNVGDVSHLEIDTEQKQAAVYLKEKREEVLDELEKHSSQGGDVPINTKPVILQKHDIINLPWDLEPEQLTLFILNHTAWLNPLGEDGYKLEFRGSLLGGGNSGSTGGDGSGGSGGSSDSGGGGQCRPNAWYSDCDSRGNNCTLNITVCGTRSDSYNSNDHYVSGHSGKSGDNGRSGGYGSSSSSGVSSGHGSSGGSVSCYVAPDLSRRPHYTANPRAMVLWQQNIILNYPDNMAHYLKKNAFLPKDYIKDKLLDDALLQVVLDYNWDMPSPMRIALETLSYMARQDLRNMLNGLSQTRDYTVPLSKSDALKRLIIMSDMYIEMVSPDVWGVGPGSDCFNWGQLKKINTKSAITKVLVPQLFDTGIDLLKKSGQPVYKGSKYLLTQNRNGEIAVACPYNELVYPLFAEDRPVGDSYLPDTYIYDGLLDQTLWKTVHQYVNGTLSKSPYSTTWKEYIYHIEPAFYVVRTALKEAVEQAGKSKEYTSLTTRSSLEQQLEQAIAYHILLTPLFNQDSSLNITKTIAPMLFNKGIDLLQASRMSLVKNPSPYTLTPNINGHLSSVCPWNGLLYPLFPDDRTNYKAFLPATYVRNGYETYLDHFFYQLAGEAFNGQEKSNMRHVLAPLSHLSRAAFKDIPIKQDGFPSLKESSVLLLEMAGDVMYGMPLNDLLSKAQQFFDKKVPFKKINNDVLIHQHLTQNMLAQELTEERWELGDQYWKTTSPVAQWGVIANVLEAVARQYGIVGARIHGLTQLIEVVQKGGFEFVSMNKEERKAFLDQHVEEGFGLKVAEWSDYDVELMQVRFNGIPNLKDMIGLGGKFGGGGIGRLRGMNKPPKVEIKEQKIEINQIKINNEKVSQTNKSVQEYLGKDYKIMTNNQGDKIFLSNDGNRKVRFDYKYSHGDKQHVHIEEKDISGKWKDATSQHRIYFEGDLK